MYFLIHSHASPAALTAPDDPELDERHWTYWDTYADALIARGPTLGSDRNAWTGSIHVLDLPGPDAARELVEREPYHLAGAYSHHDVWRFEDILGTSMWSFARSDDDRRYFLLPRRTSRSRPGPLELLAPQVRDRVIVAGALIDPVSDGPAGTAVAIQAPDRATVASLLVVGLDPILGTQETDVHDWEFGGRR